MIFQDIFSLTIYGAEMLDIKIRVFEIFDFS